MATPPGAARWTSVLLAGCLVPLAAMAQDAPGRFVPAPERDAPVRSTRQVGFGVGSTGGVVLGRSRSLELTSPVIGLLDLNAIVPLARRVELQLWLPLSLIVWNNRAVGPFFEGALIARVHPVLGAGFYLGPGLDLVAFQPRSSSTTDYALTVPLAVGYESDYPDGGFGFSIALRPLVGLLIDGRAGVASRIGAAYGVIVEFDVLGYLRPSPSPSPSASLAASAVARD